MTREDLETRLRSAISAVTEGAVESVRKAAVQFDVPRTTLQRRMKGIQPHKTAHEPAQRFSIGEEDSITRHILQMSVWGWPMTINSLETRHRYPSQKQRQRASRSALAFKIPCPPSRTQDAAFQTSRSVKKRCFYIRNHQRVV